MDVPGRRMDLPGRILSGCLPVLILQLCLLWGSGVEAKCMVRVYYNLSSPIPSYVDQVCDVACCGHYPNVYCCDQCDSTFRNADGHLSSGAVTGIVLGVLIGLVTLFVIFVYVYGRWRRNKDPVGRAMYRLYRMSTRRRRRPNPQTEQNGQTSSDGPSTITMANGGTQNRGFREGPGNFPRSRRRSPGTAETPMHTEQLSKPPRPGQRDPRNTASADVHSGEDQVKPDPKSKNEQFNAPPVHSNKGQSSRVDPSAPPAMELDSRRLEKQSYNNYSYLPTDGKAQKHEQEKSHSDEIKPYSGHSDKPYQAVSKRQDEHPYTVPQSLNPRDRYAMPRDNGEKQRLNSESRLGPPSQPYQYSGGNKTSYSPDGRAIHPPDKNASYQPDRQTSHHPNRDISQPPHSSDKNTSYQSDRHTSHLSDRNTSHPSDRHTSHPSDRNTSHPSDRNTSHPSDRHTSHPSDKNTSYPSDRHTAHPSNKKTSHSVGKTNRDVSNWRDPPPSYPSTKDGRGGPGYVPYSSTPDRGAPSRQPEYKDTPIGQGERDYRQNKDDRGVYLGNPGGSRQSQI